jgi:methionine-rich copper-binding protein CopC
MKRALSLLVSGLIAAAVMLGLAGPALAHNVLISSDPKDGASVDAGPALATLTFDQPVQSGDKLNSVTVIGPDNTHWEASGDPTVKGNAVIASLRPLGPAGEYTVGYRVLSADGHPVTGSVKFTLTKAGNGTPATAGQASSQATSGSASGGDGGMPIWPWIIGAVVLLGGGVFLALRGGSKEDSGR